jgi:hypothetical protein
LYFDIFVFISLVIHGRFFRCLSIFWGATPSLFVSSLWRSR